MVDQTRADAGAAAAAALPAPPAPRRLRRRLARLRWPSWPSPRGGVRNATGGGTEAATVVRVSPSRAGWHPRRKPPRQERGLRATGPATDPGLQPAAAARAVPILGVAPT